MTISADARNRLGVAMASFAGGTELCDAVDAINALPSNKFYLGDGNGLAQEVTLSGDITTTNAGVTAIGAGKVTQAMIAPASEDATVVKVVADANVIGGIPVVFRVAIADASADTDVVMTHKVRVIRFEFLDTGIGAHATLDTVQLKNLATAITDAVAKTATVNKFVSASTYDPAQVEIAAGGTLRITAAKNTNVAGVAYITALRVA